MNSTVFASKEALNYWMPVDWYNGGMEHTTLHLLYSRFWHKFLYDEGLVPCSEPYKRRTSHGMILGADNEKMSKSRANVVNPDDVVKEYGADTFRVYEMFIGAFDQAAPWSTQGMIGVFRFLNKVWNLLEKVSDKASSISSDNIRLMHKTIMRVGARIESMKFNTAISEIMYYTNELFSMNSVPKQMFEILCRLLYPFAPHIAEELWQRLGHKNSLAYESWPQYDSRLIKEKEIELAVQVNGKIKDRIIVAAEADEDQIKQKALSCEKVIAAMAGKKPKKIIVIKSRLVNIVV
jgi:leucyl-tRNA synthetase